MAKKQTRRGISVKGSSYRRLKAHCDARGISMSRWLEAQIVETLGPPDADEIDPPPENGGKLDEDDDTEQEDPRDADPASRPPSKRPPPEPPRPKDAEPPELAGYVPPIKLL